RHFRFERHAADRAGARALLSNFRMHRAGVDRALDHGFRCALTKILWWFVDEFGAASGRAEIIRVSVILGAMLRGMRIDRHAADGIDDAAFRWLVVVVMVVCRGHVFRYPCAIYPWGVYSLHGKEQQGRDDQAPRPHRGSGARAVSHGGGGP